MSLGKLQQGSIERARHAGAFFYGRSCRSAVSILAAFLLFLGSLMPSWHQASAAAAASGEFSQLQLLPGVQLEELEASICHHGDGNTSGIPDHDQSQPCKNCPLCIAFHYLPPVPHRAFDCAAYGPSGSTTFPLCRPALTHVREIADQRRPRAPPLRKTLALK
jgi:hypothetical protein